MLLSLILARFLKKQTKVSQKVKSEIMKKKKILKLLESRIISQRIFPKYKVIMILMKPKRKNQQTKNKKKAQEKKQVQK